MMGSEFVIWWLLAILAVAFAVAMVAVRNPVHSALCLVVNFVALAIIYLLLSAPLLAALQLVVYAGAIMVLFLFVVMFFKSSSDRNWLRPQLKAQLIIGGMAVLVFLVLLISIGLLGANSESTAGMSTVVNTQGSVSATEMSEANPQKLGSWMFGYHVLPFQLIGVLLLIAMIAALMVARDPRAEGRSRFERHAPARDDILPREVDL
jgi:NADH-quinone oxidoreductase subunit J